MTTTPEPESVREVIVALMEGKSGTATEWLAQLLEAAGHVHFNSLWVVFAVGQAGMAHDKGNTELAREMLSRLDTDIGDLELACKAFVGAARAMHYNAMQNLGS